MAISDRAELRHAAELMDLRLWSNIMIVRIIVLDGDDVHPKPVEFTSFYQLSCCADTVPVGPQR